MLDTSVEAVSEYAVKNERSEVALQESIATSPVSPPQVPVRGVSPLTSAEWHMVSRHLALSRRESQVARLMLDDLADDDIARHLSISPHTVHAHVTKLYRKLAVHSRHQLIIRLFNAYVSSSSLRRISSA
jgi:DNA-binding CsgD family transcriptional regulator